MTFYITIIFTLLSQEMKILKRIQRLQAATTQLGQKEIYTKLELTNRTSTNPTIWHSQGMEGYQATELRMDLLPKFSSQIAILSKEGSIKCTITKMEATINLMKDTMSLVCTIWDIAILISQGMT